ncbi:TIGR03767 family metallophosphoesterase [Streptomyces sp. J2-1]|uniref:TIGR03767 family metallophosphoesterase n=1 Tax=Streptomyces corallincola TaxID=2851888 RepID=UPI001C390EE9|nr:TIGR03767 family metallophosphoesterase [Streptomyces corallincola]MBV2356528.1 TIGR03767 family metallophosphoesterase [Streptomyces corallincola]
MPRPRPADSSAPVHRRSVLAAAGAVTLSAGLGYALRPTDSEAAVNTVAEAEALNTSSPSAGSPVLRPTGGPARPPVPYTRGTTLASVAAPAGSGSGFRRLAAGPGWKRVVRTDLAAAKSGRAERRTTLAAFVQLTDLHLTDVQHPLRPEFLRAADPHGWRPHEALTVPGAISLIERVNALRGGPATGAPLRFVMTTGDNTDNNARCELEWFMKVMSGGRFAPNTGDATHYEGVQNSGVNMYWQPDSTVRDAEKALGFPYLKGYLGAAVREVRSPGLTLPWYSTAGNHDTLPLGCFDTRGDQYLVEAAVGGRKLMDVSAADAQKLQNLINKASGDPRGVGYRDLLKKYSRSQRAVTPDESRAPYTQADYLRIHLDPAYQGAGPAGHGYTAANLDAGTRYYAFRVSGDVVGISLDTTDAGGHFKGSVGTAQLSWLERTLKAHRDDHVIVFSHHTSKTMTNQVRDPARPDEKRHDGDELVRVLAAHPQVLAWVNGHTHRNIITAHRTSAGGSFWEVCTASHIDHPQLARIVELVDNHDGTLSLFTTLVESAAPARTDFADLSQTGLAALYRELSYNAPGVDRSYAGTPADRNTELVLRKR